MMASTSSTFFAFELLNKSVDNQLCKKEDVIILFTHWFMVKSGFRCIGLGDSKTIDGNEEGSECLPDGWNNQEFYSLRYVKDGDLVILLGRKSDENLLLNLLKVKDSCVGNVKFPIASTVNFIHGPLSLQIPRNEIVMQEINKFLIEPILPPNGREMSTQTPSSQQSSRPNPQDFPANDPLRVGNPRQPDALGNIFMDNPREVGRRDLDPFGGFGPRGGGMIFDPFPHGNRIPLDPLRPGGIGGPPHLPPGAIPPGARFDPFGPPDLDRPRRLPRNPNNDHEPAPGFEDMFM